jgi:hypothetical protein
MVLDLHLLNYTFRPELQLPLMCLLEIFIVKHFTIPKMLYRDTNLMAVNLFCPPGEAAELRAWIHHVVGNRGIFQKL